MPRAVYSTSDTTDPLNAEIDDEIYIDTKDLCKRVAYELKQVCDFKICKIQI